eukprot:jgi/Mesen1/2363/ME000156S01507
MSSAGGAGAGGAGVGPAVQADWENREFSESVKLNTRRIYEFIREIEAATRSKLALLNEKLTALERQMEFLEAQGRRHLAAAAAAGTTGFKPPKLVQVPSVQAWEEEEEEQENLITGWEEEQEISALRWDREADDTKDKKHQEKGGKRRRRAGVRGTHTDEKGGGRTEG